VPYQASVDVDRQEAAFVICLDGEHQRLIVDTRAPRHCPAPSAA
jgi:hypothetical protein